MAQKVQQPTRDPARTRTGQKRSTAGASSHDRLLDLQESAGNQAVTSLLTSAAVQRSPDEKAIQRQPATAGEITFVIQRPNDQYTKDVTTYIGTTLRSSSVPVKNLDDICAYVGTLPAGTKFNNVRIVSHGQSDIGGVGMTPAGESKWRYVTPDEIRKYASSGKCAALKSLVAKGGSVEFWGCYLGSVPGAADAWAQLFNAPVRSSSAEMHIGADTFGGGKQVYTKSADVPTGAQAKFRKWLLERYKLLSGTGEAPVLKTEQEQFNYMVKLFDRSRGVIRSRVLMKKGDKTPFRPGDYQETQLWHTADP